MSQEEVGNDSRAVRIFPSRCNKGHIEGNHAHFSGGQLRSRQQSETGRHQLVPESVQVGSHEHKESPRRRSVCETGGEAGEDLAVRDKQTRQFWSNEFRCLRNAVSPVLAVVD